ncbi:MAG: hypothetical protein LBO75_01520, partial [Bifidobacteriaceae bacterium]|nr:hypothetical protein [Bifidobacteriaceae bacterium]
MWVAVPTLSLRLSGAMAPRLTFRTFPAHHPASLLEGTDARAAVWLHQGQGFVGLGQAARFEATGPDRLAAAESWWREILRHSRVEGSRDQPAMGPLALGSFTFSGNSPEPSVLLVPRVVRARYGGKEWITYADQDGQEPYKVFTKPDAATPPAQPPHLTEQPGPIGATQWPERVAQALALVQQNVVEKVVLARSVLASSTTGPIDVRT